MLEAEFRDLGTNDNGFGHPSPEDWGAADK
jgi:hypothetical protein